MINALPDGYTVEFDIKLISNMGTPTDFVATAVPTYLTAPFARTGYLGVGGWVALYLNVPTSGVANETIRIENIVVINSKGVATTTYEWVAADAEETQEIWSVATNGPVWALLDNLEPTNGNPPTSPLVSGIGTSFVEETGNGIPVTHTSGPVYISNAPTAIDAACITESSQAFAFGIVITDREQAIADLVESVALEQTALSHILNAEGEKLQRVVSGGGTVDQILEVNESAEDMVRTIARLELVLARKLDFFPCGDCLCHGDAEGEGTP